MLGISLWLASCYSSSSSITALIIRLASLICSNFFVAKYMRSSWNSRSFSAFLTAYIEGLSYPIQANVDGPYPVGRVVEQAP